MCVSTCVHVDMQAHTPQGLTAVSTSVCVCIAAQGTVYLCSHPCARAGAHTCLCLSTPSVPAHTRVYTRLCTRLGTHPRL